MGNITTRPTYIVNDLFTWIKGNHTWSRRASSTATSAATSTCNGNEAGTFSFGRGATGVLGVNSGSPIASFLLGAVDNGNVDFRSVSTPLPAAGRLHPPRRATPGRSTAS